MRDISILEDVDLEIKAKYLYLFLLTLFYNDKSAKQIEATAEEITHAIGISLNMFYRARSILVKRGIIRHSNRYCSETGKKIRDVYEIDD